MFHDAKCNLIAFRAPVRRLQTPQAVLAFYPLQKGYSFRFVHELERVSIFTCRPRLFTSARVPLSFIFPRFLQKISTYAHDSSVSPSWKISPAEADSSGRLSLDLSSRGFPGEGYDEREVWAYTQRYARKSPFLLTLHGPASSTTLSLIPRVSLASLLAPFPSPALFSSHLRDALPLDRPYSAPFHAPSRTRPLSFFFSPSRTLLVRFHPRPSTFRVYRTIARARITVTGRATSWLAVDVGGGRTADRRRRERRRRRRRRRGRA